MAKKKATSIQAEKGFVNPQVSNTIITPTTKSGLRGNDSGISLLSAPIDGVGDGFGGGFVNKSTVEDYLKQPDFNFNSIDQKSSTKTNFYILNNNWVAVVKYLKNLKSVVKWLYDNIQIEALVQQVLDKLETAKNEIPVSFDLPITDSYQVVSNRHTYKITRVDEYIITIECLTKKLWDVRNLMVSVKNNDNILVYPTVQTVDSKVRIDFIDRLATNYRIIFI